MSVTFEKYRLLHIKLLALTLTNFALKLENLSLHINFASFYFLIFLLFLAPISTFPYLYIDSLLIPLFKKTFLVVSSLYSPQIRKLDYLFVFVKR